MRIDPHVHCRDWKQSYKATIGDVFSLAKSQGVNIIFDMPNTDPPIIYSVDVDRRLRTAEEQGVSEGYFLYIGVTSDRSQIREAVDVVKKNPKVVGLKMFAGRSVGDLSVIKESDQKTVYETLSKLDYRGVISVHCEKESLFRNDLWDPTRPETWNDARPEISEVESIRDQIKFAAQYSFKGTLHICHVSTPMSVDVIRKAKKRGKISIVCGATPHHLFYSTDDMAENGLMLKVNPPIRSAETRKNLMYELLDGRIDWIETDHAPHTIDEKLNEPYASGIRSLELYSELIKKLNTMGVPKERIDDLTYNNIVKVFRKAGPITFERKDDSAVYNHPGTDGFRNYRKR
ncbi:MAG: dihydroorotase [Candidatus Aenigmatarchaeota archaeon]